MSSYYFDDFVRDGWTPEQYEYCSRAAFDEAAVRGDDPPVIDYDAALDWHRRHKRGVVLIPAEEIREKVSE